MQGCSLRHTKSKLLFHRLPCFESLLYTLFFAVDLPPRLSHRLDTSRWVRRWSLPGPVKCRIEYAQLNRAAASTKGFFYAVVVGALVFVFNTIPRS